MKQYTNIIFSAALMFLAFGCSSSDDVINDSEQEIQSNNILLKASIGNLESRVSTDAQGVQHFETGDAFGVTVWDWADNANGSFDPAKSLHNNVQTTLGADGKWTSAQNMPWKDQTAEHVIFALYPFSSNYNIKTNQYGKVITELPLTYKKQADPNFDYLAANDYLAAIVTTKPTNDAVQLHFTHLLGKLIVNVKTARSSVVKPEQMKGAVVNAYAKGGVCTTEDGDADYYFSENRDVAKENIVLRTSIEPKQGYSRAFCTLVPAQIFNKIAVGVETTPGKVETYTCDFYSPTFVNANQVTIINLTLYDDKLTLDNITIKPWNEVNMELDNENECISSVDPKTHTIVAVQGTLTADDITTALNGGNKLIIEGYINGNDINTLRQSADKIADLDLTNVTIVDGGGYLVDGKMISSETSIITEKMFSNMPLTSLKLPNNIQGINAYAFNGCNNLKSFSLPQTGSLKYLMSYSLAGVPVIKDMVIPQGVKYVGYSLFAETDNAESLTLPAGTGFVDDELCNSGRLGITKNFKTLKILSPRRYADLGVLNINPSSSNVILYLHESHKQDVVVKNGEKYWVHNPHFPPSIPWKDIIFVDSKGNVLNPQPTIN